MKHIISNIRVLSIAVVLLASALSISSCVVSENPVSGNRRAYGYSWEEERQLGQEADQQIVAQYGVYENEELSGYVDRIGQKVLAESHLRRPDTDPQFRNTPFTFRVLDSPIVNAFALPGGYVYVTRGLLAHLNNEAQLAVVLGHEVGHVAARHASQRAFKQQFAQIGLLGGAILGQEILGGAAGQNILNLGGTAAQLLLLSYSRDNERESDELGVEYAARAGYKAGEGSEFFRSLERISEQHGGGLPTWQSTHPDPGEREQTIQQLAQEWSQRVPSMTDVHADAYYNAIDGMVVGNNPRQGFVERGAFYHPDLRFQFPVPSGFQVDNQMTQVVMVQQDQQAIMLFTFASEATSARQAGTEFARQQGITVVEQGETRVNGRPAYVVLADAQTQQGQVVRVQTYFIEYGGTVYVFIGYAQKSAFSTYRDTFLRTMRGFDELSDPEVLNVQPTRLRITTASRNAPFQSFVPEDLPDDLSADGLAILNQVQLDASIASGHRLKLPGQ